MLGGLMDARERERRRGADINYYGEEELKICS
jgi:hypothetical protein